jgi:hypothetical protein
MEAWRAMDDYENIKTFHGDPERVFDLEITILAALGFVVTARSPSQIEFLGPGMRSTRQSALVGAGRVRIELKRNDQLTVTADFGGVEGLSRFLKTFLMSMAAGFVLLFGVGMGLLFGQIFGVGFGVPFAPGVTWLAFAAPLAVAPFIPWIFVYPFLMRMTRRKTEQALDGFTHNISTVPGVSVAGSHTGHSAQGLV